MKENQVNVLLILCETATKWQLLSCSIILLISLESYLNKLLKLTSVSSKARKVYFSCNWEWSWRDHKAMESLELEGTFLRPSCLQGVGLEVFSKSSDSMSVGRVLLLAKIVISENVCMTWKCPGSHCCLSLVWCMIKCRLWEEWKEMNCRVLKFYTQGWVIRVHVWVCAHIMYVCF